MESVMVVIDGEKMLNRRAAHDHLAGQLDLPDYYGRNLDALYDMLSERDGRTQLVVRHSGTLLSWLGDYGKALCQTLEDAERVNPGLEVIFTDE